MKRFFITAKKTNVTDKNNRGPCKSLPYSPRASRHVAASAALRGRYFGSNGEESRTSRPFRNLFSLCVSRRRPPVPSDPPRRRWAVSPVFGSDRKSGGINSKRTFHRQRNGLYLVETEIFILKNKSVKLETESPLSTISDSLSTEPPVCRRGHHLNLCRQLEPLSAFNRHPLFTLTSSQQV